MPPRFETTSPVTVSALWFAWWQTLVISATFAGTLYTSIRYHWAGIVKNEWYSEWWPSISAVVGDDPPERNIFAYGMAVAGPAKVVCCLLVASICARRVAACPNASESAGFWARFTGHTGFLRLLAAAGWIFITSSDNGVAHAVAMAIYLVITCFYFMAHIYATVLVDAHDRSRGASWRQVGVFWWRVVWCVAFMLLMCAAIGMFVQHKLHRVIGGTSVDRSRAICVLPPGGKWAFTVRVCVCVCPFGWRTEQFVHSLSDRVCICMGCTCSVRHVFGV